MQSNKPTESELQILQIHWEFGPSSVRYVNDKLNDTREVGYTTTLKIMQIMSDKDLVSRDTTQRTHIYSSHVSEDHTQQNLLSSFINSAFRGSATKLVMQALGTDKATTEELQEIKDLIAKIEKTKS